MPFLQETKERSYGEEQRMTSSPSSHQGIFSSYKFTYISNNLSHIKTILTDLNQITLHNSSSFFSIHHAGNLTEHLKGSADLEGDYYVAENRDDDDGASDQEDDVDNSNYIYIVNTVLSGTARLNVLLPTATILAFTIFTPLLTNDGKCTTMGRWLMGFFLALAASSCVFFSFTDSFRTSSGRLYYRVATLHGIRNFGGGRTRARLPSEHRLRWSDMFHASLSLTAFLTFALLHNDVLSCYHLALTRKFINSFPLVVGFVISLLFVLFPSKRRGIGYPFLLQIDGFHNRK